MPHTADMTVARSSVVAAVVALCGLGALLLASVLGLGPGGRYGSDGWVLLAAWVPAVTCAVLGLRVVERQPRNPVGWVLVAMTGAAGVTNLAEVLGYRGLVQHVGPPWLATLGVAGSLGGWILAFAGLGYLVLLFPDGRPASPRWRRFPAVMGVVLAGAYVGATIQPGPMGDQYGDVANPLGVAAADRAPLVLVIGAFMVATLLCLVLCCVHAVLRYRRAEGTIRLQLRWLGYLGVAVPVALVACFATDAALGTTLGGDILLPLALTVVPVGLAAAVLRFRIYDLDHLISRTVSWALVSAAVALAFVAASVVAGMVAGRDSPARTAVASVAALATLWAVRSRVQSLVDVRFDRATARSVARVDEFIQRLHAGSGDAARIGHVVADALGEPGQRLVLRSDDRWLSVDGAVVPTPVPGPGEVVLDLGPALLVRPADPPGDSHRVRTVLEHARPGIELARARAEVSLHLREVEASRARIVLAGDHERRRIERDLHDGAQQRLVALGVTVRRLQLSLPPDAAPLDAALDQVVESVAAAVTDLRRLAAGLRPARLDDGLGPALQDLARTTPIPVRLRVTDDRTDPTIETTAYFVACEGVTNAVKHSQAASIDVVVDVVRSDPTRPLLVVSVTDDGVGGARRGSGLAGLQDRVAAHRGTLRLQSPPGGGTRLEAVLPCGS